MPDILHLGAAPQHLSPAQLRTLKAEFPKVSLMRSIPVVDESSIALARSYDGIADWLLLDSYESGDRQIGALGVTHSWELDRRIIESVRIPAIIAGGLGPENVQEAIRVARPAGVDSKTKTDKSDGSHTKDLQKVSAFVKAARGPKRFERHQTRSLAMTQLPSMAKLNDFKRRVTPRKVSNDNDPGFRGALSDIINLTVESLTLSDERSRSWET